MSCLSDRSGGRNGGPECSTLATNPHRGGGLLHSKGCTPTPPPGMPERNTLFKREYSGDSGGRCHGQPEPKPEYSGPTIPAHSGPRVVAVYSDGGLIRSNPSPIGGMWAWCHVDADGWRVREESGILQPSDVEGRDVTNHHTETYALLAALEALPDGWSGRACSDSKNAIRVFFGEGSLRNLPAAWRPRVGAVLRRLGRIEAIRLDGHPTRAQLAAGVGKRGAPVSEHNVRVDFLCTEAGKRFMLARTAVRA